MRISGKKILAIALSVAMLVSCMVFSFSADAATSFNWEVNFNSAAQQAAYVAKTSGVAGNYTTGDSAAHGKVEAVASGGRTDGNDGALQASFTSTAGGKFIGMRVCDSNAAFDKPNAGVNTLVSFWYKPVNITGEVKIYAALAGFYWGSANCSASDFRGGEDANVLMASVSVSSDGWYYVSAILKSTQQDGVHICFSTGKQGSVILIDDILVRNVNSADITKVTYLYNETEVGTSSLGAAGAYLPEPKLDIPVELPEGYAFVAYTDNTFTTKADVSVYPATDTKVYLRAEKVGATHAVETYDRYPFLLEDGTPNTLTEDVPVPCTDNITANGATYWRYANTYINGNGSGRWLTNAYNHTDESGASVALSPQPYSQNYPAYTQLKVPSTGSTFAAAAGNNGYEVSFWVRAGAGATGTATFSLKGVAENGHNAANSKTVTLTEEWQKVWLAIGALPAGSNLYLFGGYQKFPAGLDTSKTEFENIEAGVDCFIYVDDVSLEDAVQLTYTADYEYTNTYENVKIDNANLELKHGNSSNVRYSAEKNHTWVSGARNSVRVFGQDRSGANRPQFNLTTENGDTLYLQDDTAYEVSMWIYSSTENTKDGLGLWLVAADDADAATWSGGADRAKYDITVEKETTVNDYTLITRGEWKQFTFTITPASVAAAEANGVEVVGKPLRLGLCNESNAFLFYVDDVSVKVSEDVSAWSFESEDVGTDLDIKNADIKVSADVARTGSHSLYHFSNTNGGSARQQFYIKDGNGNAAKFEQGKSYLFSFWMYVPDYADRDYKVNIWLYAGDGTVDRTGAAKVLDDGATATKYVAANSTWVKITKYIPNAAASGDVLFGLANGESAKHYCYIDDIEFVCVDDMLTRGDAEHNDRDQYLFGTEVGGVKTNLHKHTSNPNDNGAYTSIRLGATYKAGDASGTTIIINGEEYELVERGILVGLADADLDVDNYTWKSSKAASEGLNTYFDRGATITAGANDPIDVKFTLRLSNMSQAWFDGTGNAKQTAAYQYRSYYKIKVPYLETNGTRDLEATVTVYGNASDAFTFADLVGDFELNGWFSEVEAAE